MARLVRASHDHRRSGGSAATAALPFPCSPRILFAGPALAAAFFCGDAWAGAWPVPPGETLAILKYEQTGSDEAYDLDGRLYGTPERSDTLVSLFVEHGLTDRLTAQGKLAWAEGEDAGAAYEGRGPFELGLRYTFYKHRRAVVAVYGGVVVAGEGRNAGYADPGQGGTDFEARLLAGRSLRAAGREVFVEAQVARLLRQGLPDETRLDLTAGVEPSPNWLLLAQSYAGWTDEEPQWIKLEASAVRRFGPWRLQAGWRASVAGKASPAEAGPVLAVWRRF